MVVFFDTPFDPLDRFYLLIAMRLIVAVDHDLSLIVMLLAHFTHTYSLATVLVYFFGEVVILDP